MIKANNVVVDVNHFPDGTLLLKRGVNQYDVEPFLIEWYFENNEELVALIFLTKHLYSCGVKQIKLYMPYIPNARQDRVKTNDDIFTLKYFAEVINSLNFCRVVVCDPHSYVSEALFDRITVLHPTLEISKAITKCDPDLLFYPDEGAMKRYSANADMEYVFGLKRRDWATGKIQGLDVVGDVDKIKGKKILIIDDICSKGGTFYHSAKKLRELGASEVYLYITHCENTIFEGELLTTDLIDKIYTTNSILTKTHEKIEVFEI